jgi:hypothetical protein
VKFSAALFAWKSENDSGVEVSQSAKDLPITDDGVERDRCVYEEIAAREAGCFLDEASLECSLRSLGEPLLHPAIILELVFL